MSAGRRSEREQSASRLPVDASMTLLNEVMLRPLDPSYAHAARRRARGGEPPRRPAAAVGLVVLAAALGFATASATLQLRAPQPSALAARSLLEQEIVERRAEVEATTARNATLRSAIDALQAAVLATQDPELLELLERDALATGTVAVAGPGISLTVSDGPDAVEDPRGYVQDQDLQHVVNALWASGAEAISVNGHRLTAKTAIRSAGQAILVDLVGVSGPYEIQAIGDRNDLETGYARSAAAAQMEALRGRYGISTRISRSDELTLPAGSSTVLFYAQVADEDNRP